MMMSRGRIALSTFLAVSFLLAFSFFFPSLSYSQGSPVIDTPNIEIKTAAQAIEQLVMANRIIANEGVVDALGHISIRNPENPETFFITRALAPLEVTKRDIVEVNLDGKVVSKPVLRIGGETFIHSAILKARPEMHAVFHGHHPSILRFGVLDIPMRPLINTGGFMYQGVRVFGDYSPRSGFLISTKEDGERVAKHLGQDRVQLLRSHGVNVVAETLPRLVACSIFLIDNANLQWQAIQSGKEPRYLTPEEAKECMDKLLQYSTMSRYWGYWTAKVRYAMPDMK